MTRIKLPILTLLLCLGGASPAFADLTAFVGSTTTPENRTAKGAALGINLFVIGFEFEFASTSEKPEVDAPSLRTGSGNLLVQTPLPILGLQPYFTSGGGMYRERLGDASETHFAFNTGGGVKVSLMGPIRARLDYRVFRLRGEPLHPTVHRLYAGVNLAF